VLQVQLDHKEILDQLVLQDRRVQLGQAVRLELQEQLVLQVQQATLDPLAQLVQLVQLAQLVQLVSQV